MRRPLAPWVLVPALLTACSSGEYVCPDPIGAIIRDDCDVYRTRYESLKVQLGFSIGGLGFSAGAGRERLRDPSELLQLLMQQTMSLCKDFNACRVAPADYRRRREQADRKFTAITAISEQLKQDLDPESKRALVAQLIEVITDARPRADAGKRPRPRPRKRCTHWLPGATSMYFASRFQPPRPALPAGVPALASWQITVARGVDGASSHVLLSFWGEAEPDDRVRVALSGPGASGRAPVKPSRDRDQASARVTFAGKRLRERGTMTVHYRPGATMKRHLLGTFDIDASKLPGRAYLAYMPDPLRGCPVAYERPQLVFHTLVSDNREVTVRCKHRGEALPMVLRGDHASGTYRASRMARFHVPLPVRIPLKGGTERRGWKVGLGGGRRFEDLLGAEAAGPWTCAVSFAGRVGRRLRFTLGRTGAPRPAHKPGPLASPWWPIEAEVLDNPAERERAAELAAERAAAAGGSP